jgi:hypothetical protein
MKADTCGVPVSGGSSSTDSKADKRTASRADVRSMGEMVFKGGMCYEQFA